MKRLVLNLMKKKSGELVFVLRGKRLKPIEGEEKTITRRI